MREVKKVVEMGASAQDELRLFLAELNTMKCIGQNEWVVVFDAAGPLYGGQLRAYNPQNLSVILHNVTCLRDGRRFPKVLVRGDIVKRIEWMPRSQYEKYVSDLLEAKAKAVGGGA